MITLLTHYPSHADDGLVRLRDIEAQRSRMRAWLKHTRRLIDHEQIAVLRELRKLRQA